jgi:hypothetical protein
MVIENFEEIIPRELNTEKEKQIGVPFNISWGGGTQGLHDSLIFDKCSIWDWSVTDIETDLVYTACSGTVITLTGLTGQSGTIYTKNNTLPYFTTASTASTLTYKNDYRPYYGPYAQDPELFPNEILSATTLSGLTTEILLEQNFGGTFMGGLSQFRLYTEPLGSPQIQHNFRILKNDFNLFDYWCPNCLPADEPCQPSDTHPYTHYFIYSVNTLGTISDDIDKACQAKTCLNNASCNATGSYTFYMDEDLPRINDKLFVSSTGCAYSSSLNGYFAVIYLGKYYIFEVTNGIITCQYDC